MLYLFGGWGLIEPDSEPGTVADTWQYDPATDTWTDTGQPMNVPRIWHGYASNTKFIAVAGGSPDDVDFIPTDEVEVFAPAFGWISQTPMEAGKGRLAPGLSLSDMTATAALIQFGGAYLDSGDFILDPETLVCGNAGSCAEWGPVPFGDGKQLVTPRWFAPWASPNVRQVRGFIAGGEGAGGVGFSSAERLP